MSLLYALLLISVAAMIVGLLREAASKVGRPFNHAKASCTKLTLVATVDRRTQRLPFAGHDRREFPLTVEAALAYAELRRDA